LPQLWIIPLSGLPSLTREYLLSSVYVDARAGQLFARSSIVSTSLWTRRSSMRIGSTIRVSVSCSIMLFLYPVSGTLARC